MRDEDPVRRHTQQAILHHAFKRCHLSTDFLLACVRDIHPPFDLYRKNVADAPDEGGRVKVKEREGEERVKDKPTHKYTALEVGNTSWF